MRRIQPVLAVAALMAAIVGEGCLRKKVYQFDEAYVSVLGLIDGTARCISSRQRTRIELETIAQIFPPIAIGHLRRGHRARMYLLWNINDPKLFIRPTLPWARQPHRR